MAGRADRASWTSRRCVFLLMVNLLFLILGCFLDTLLMLLVIVPIILPSLAIVRHRSRAFRRRRSSST